MKEIKLTIDGKEVQLTDEQLKMLGIEPEKKRKNPFERGIGEEEYYFINSGMGITRSQSTRDSLADTVYAASNYFTDKDFAKRVSLHQLLYRKLLKFAYDNECEDTAEWDGVNEHYCITYDIEFNKVDVTHCSDTKFSIVYFSSEEETERAIKEVVWPFMKEHPEFVW